MRFSPGDYEPRRSGRRTAPAAVLESDSDDSSEDGWIPGVGRGSPSSGSSDASGSEDPEEREAMPVYVSESEEEEEAQTTRHKSVALFEYEDDDPDHPEIGQVLFHEPEEATVSHRAVHSGDVRFMIKFKYRSHLHNALKTDAELRASKGYKKVATYLKQQREMQEWLRTASAEERENAGIVQETAREEQVQFQQVDRIVASRGMAPHMEYLVLWAGLSYADCTWEPQELLTAFQSKIDEFLERDANAPVQRSVKRGSFVELETDPVWLPPGLALRDYQLKGLNWLLYSWSRNTNGILADEMGLGKTIQCIVFVASLFVEYAVGGPYLIVVPLSTLEAWKREFVRWAPFLNVVVYHGSAIARATCRQFEFCVAGTRQPKFHVLLTTYEIARIDKQYLQPFKYKMMCVDEAHRLKDDSSALYTDLESLSSLNRLLITGTPLQNSLKELWCLLHFLEPRRFPSLETFEEEHAGVIEGEDLGRLHTALAPHLLRRIKKDVETALPSKTERILRVGLSPMQRKYYRWILTRNFRELNKGGTQSSLLNLVMELKKCCNHPYLFENAEQESSDPLAGLIRDSGKMVLLDQLLTRLRATGHRVLIFSQMVRMLDILSDYLDYRGFLHQRLDGAMKSQDRRAAMDKFNSPDSKDFCFLLSTRAGGLGINLATADTVIIFDSDWNPQNDLQAEARAHRIGQTKAVNIYRFVTMKTVEEDILERAKQKMILDHLVIQRMDTSGRLSSKSSKSGALFQKAELAKILQFGAKDLFDGEEAQQDANPEVDLDAILARAETRTPEAKSDETEDFLSAFKVATFTSQKPKKEDEADDDFWKKVIPAHMVPVDQAVDPEILALYSDSRRKRKAVKSYSEADLFADAANKAKAAPKRKSSSKSSGKPQSLKKRMKQVYRALLQFGSERRATLELCQGVCSSVSEEDVSKWAQQVVTAANDAVVAASSNAEEKVLFTLHDSEMDATALFKRMEEMQVLAEAVASFEDPYTNFRLSSQAPPPRRWSVAWGVRQDAMLLLGVHEHGYGSWDKLMHDPRLGLGIASEKKVTASQLATRAAFLLKTMCAPAFKPVSRKRAAVAKEEPRKKAKWAPDKAVLKQCKAALQEAESYMKKLHVLFKKHGGWKDNFSKFCKYIRHIGDEVVLCLDKKGSDGDNTMERHLWYYVALFCSGLRGRHIREIYLLLDAGDTEGAKALLEGVAQ